MILKLLVEQEVRLLRPLSIKPMPLKLGQVHAREEKGGADNKYD